MTPPLKLAIWPRYRLIGRSVITGRRLVMPLERQEGLILTALLGRPRVDAELLVEVLWPHPDDQPDTWVWCIKVRISGLRQILERIGWTVADRRAEWRAPWRMAALRAACPAPALRRLPPWGDEREDAA